MIKFPSCLCSDPVWRLQGSKTGTWPNYEWPLHSMNCSWNSHFWEKKAVHMLQETECLPTNDSEHMLTVDGCFSWRSNDRNILWEKKQTLKKFFWHIIRLHFGWELEGFREIHVWNLFKWEKGSLSGQRHLLYFSLSTHTQRELPKQTHTHIFPHPLFKSQRSCLCTLYLLSRVALLIDEIPTQLQGHNIASPSW